LDRNREKNTNRARDQHSGREIPELTKNTDFAGFYKNLILDFITTDHLIEVSIVKGELPNSNRISASLKSGLSIPMRKLLHSLATSSIYKENLGQFLPIIFEKFPSKRFSSKILQLAWQHENTRNQLVQSQIVQNKITELLRVKNNSCSEDYITLILSIPNVTNAVRKNNSLFYYETHRPFFQFFPNIFELCCKYISLYSVQCFLERICQTNILSRRELMVLPRLCLLHNLKCFDLVAYVAMTVPLHEVVDPIELAKWCKESWCNGQKLIGKNSFLQRYTL
jgi:hypothetical protein